MMCLLSPVNRAPSFVILETANKFTPALGTNNTSLISRVRVRLAVL